MAKNVVGSVERLAWAKENGCPWKVVTCAWAALKWAREHGCPCMG